MASTLERGPVHQADEDNVRHVLSTADARQGMATGRVLMVLVVSVAALAAIFAILWLTKGNISP